MSAVGGTEVGGKAEGNDVLEKAVFLDLGTLVLVLVVVVVLLPPLFSY
jgi:hypothetical protein